MNGQFSLKKLIRRWYLTVPVVFSLTGILIPIMYLTIRAFEATPRTLINVIFRFKNALLLANTIGLILGVLLLSTLIALPLAWLTIRTNIAGRQIFTILGVLPLAVPGYVMAYVLMATTGPNGSIASLTGMVIPRVSGFTGALLALSLTTFPYLFMNLRTALQGVNQKLEESARSLGTGRFKIFIRILIPQLKPGFLAGGLLVGLHVLGDFGVVSLMRFKTFTYSLYLQYTAAYDRIYAAWLALMLLVLTLIALTVEAYLLRGLVLHSSKSGQERSSEEMVELGNWIFPAYAFGGLIGLLSIGLPIMTLFNWMNESFRLGFSWMQLLDPLINSAYVSLPSAVIASLLALPIAYIGVRYSSTWSLGIERIAYLGYATPRLAFALAFIIFSLSVAPVIYQTLLLLVLAYTLHFLAEAIGPIRSAIYQISPTIEEAARSLGSGPLDRFYTVLFPLVRRGFFVSAALVFLSSMKELPLTLMLAPPGFNTLATTTWGYAEEAMFAQAAPHALALIAISSCFVWVLLKQE